MGIATTLEGEYMLPTNLRILTSDQWEPWNRYYILLLLKNDGNPISLQERAYIETTYPMNDKYVSRSY